jgi:hypothetical protein
MIHATLTGQDKERQAVRILAQTQATGTDEDGGCWVRWPFSQAGAWLQAPAEAGHTLCRGQHIEPLVRPWEVLLAKGLIRANQILFPQLPGSTHDRPEQSDGRCSSSVSTLAQAYPQKCADTGAWLKWH